MTLRHTTVSRAQSAPTMAGGLNNASPNTECWLIFGFDFGAGTKKGYKPTTVGGGL
jgi:hypothetical protein